VLKEFPFVVLHEPSYMGVEPEFSVEIIREAFRIIKQNKDCYGGLLVS